MIETEHSVVIDAGIDSVWEYTQDIQRWASLMPGYQQCAVIDADNSRWLLKVGVGGMVRTVKVLVRVDQWAGPERVNFSYSLEGDPVLGGGSYCARRKSDRATEVTLKVLVQGSGPLAPMWEAMSRPLLPQLAQSFAGKLKSTIEAISLPPAAQKSTVGLPARVARFGLRLLKLWRAIFGSRLP